MFGVAHFLDFDRVKEAICAAEGRTSGEIRVSVAPWFWGSVDRAAERAFLRLGMDRTRQHNGVLVFVVPSRHAFVVLGDSGIHARVGQDFWDGLVALMTPRFRQGDFTGGVVAAVERIGETLAAHFPHGGPADVNELPNDVDVARPR